MGDHYITIEELRDLSQQMGRSRWRLVSDVAQVAAHYLRCHPAVDEVRYPGLKSDPDFEQAARMLVGGFGPVVDYRVAGEWKRLTCEPGDPRSLVLSLEESLSRSLQKHS